MIDETQVAHQLSQTRFHELSSKQSKLQMFLNSYLMYEGSLMTDGLRSSIADLRYQLAVLDDQVKSARDHYFSIRGQLAIAKVPVMTIARVEGSLRSQWGLQ